MTPLTCSIADWSDSFKRHGWSSCGGNNLFIAGFYRLNPPGNTKDPISLLEQARCCSAILEFSDQHGICEYTSWRDSLGTYVFHTQHSLHKCLIGFVICTYRFGIKIYSKECLKKGTFQKCTLKNICNKIIDDRHIFGLY